MPASDTRIPKLVSNQYMKILNWELNNRGRAPMKKREFMFILSILTRKQQTMLTRQFETLGVMR